MPIGADYLRKKGWKESSINFLGYLICIIGIVLIIIGIIMLTPSYEMSLWMVPWDVDIRDSMESAVLARDWLQSGVSNVKQFNNRAIGSGDKGFKGSKPQRVCPKITEKWLFLGQIHDF